MAADTARARSRFGVAPVATALPAGDWHYETALTAEALDEAVLAWLLGQYRFDAYSPW